MKLNEAITAAQTADEAFEAAVKAAGYKSRWDWHKCSTDTPELLATYDAKVIADRAMGAAFQEARGRNLAGNCIGGL